jgi:hypothetical protein
MARARAVSAGFAARAAKGGERERPGFRKGVNELSGRVENTRDLVGDLLGAKNAGVTAK